MPDANNNQAGPQKMCRAYTNKVILLWANRNHVEHDLSKEVRARIQLPSYELRELLLRYPGTDVYNFIAPSRASIRNSRLMITHFEYFVPHLYFASLLWQPHHLACRPCVCAFTRTDTHSRSSSTLKCGTTANGEMAL